MREKLVGFAVGMSAIALLLSCVNVGLAVRRAQGVAAGGFSFDAMDARIEALEQDNAALRQRLESARTQLQDVASVQASRESRLRTATAKIAELEKSTEAATEAVSRFNRMFSRARGRFERTQSDADDAPKLEDYLYIDLNPINGLAGPHVILEGANLHVRSGAGATNDLGGPMMGLGNLVIGYNEPDAQRPRPRTGSHNLVVGSGHGFSSFGGFLAGLANEVTAPNAAVSGGTGNEAIGWCSSVTGGQSNIAIGDLSSVTGGVENQTVAQRSAILGGLNVTLEQEGYSQAGSLAIPP